MLSLCSKYLYPTEFLGSPFCQFSIEDIIMNIPENLYAQIFGDNFGVGYNL